MTQPLKETRVSHLHLSPSELCTWQPDSASTSGQTLLLLLRGVSSLQLFLLSLPLQSQLLLASEVDTLPPPQPSTNIYSLPPSHP